MVFLPAYGIVDGFFDHETNGVLLRYFNKAVSLSVYEFVFVTLFLVALVLNQKTTHVRKPLYLHGNKFVYFIFVFIALFLYFTRGRSMGLFEFGLKAIGGDLERSGDIKEGAVLTRTIIGEGITFLFLILVSVFSRKYHSTSNSKYIVFSIILSMFVISIISGERRTSQIYKGFACIWLLIGLYPTYRKKITGYLVMTAAIVIAGMTIYKHYNAFLYNTYAEAISDATGVGMSTGIIDAYFYGLNTISLNLSFANTAPVSFFNLVYDFARNIFGLNFVISRDYLLTSDLYNLGLTFGESVTGYLLSSVGYGYLYFGFVLSPIFTCMNVSIMVLLERYMRTTTSIEMSYILSILFMRFGFGFLGSFPPLINLTTRIFCISGGIVLVASFFNESSFHKARRI